LATAAVVGGLSAGVGIAGKPVGGGGVDTGTVYFWLFGNQNRMWTMNPDGTSKTALPSVIPWRSVPSRAMHGGHRWFLYAADDVFAVRDDGTGVVQLTTQANLTSSSVQWAPGDASISWIADGGVAGQEGVFVADTVFDGSGHLTGLDAQPSQAAVPLAGAASHDWAPDGDRLVVGDTSWALWIASLSSGAASHLATAAPAGSPVWSPDGTLIAYQEGASKIHTIATDGTGDRTIVSVKGPSSQSVGDMAWSPNGTHLVYYKAGSAIRDERTDVYRATSSGGSKTNLTGDLDTRAMSGTPAYPLGWR